MFECYLAPKTKQELQALTYSGKTLTYNRPL